MAVVPTELLEHPVSGFNVPVGSTLRSLVRGEVTLLVFLRHHG